LNGFYLLLLGRNLLFNYYDDVLIINEMKTEEEVAEGVDENHED